MDRRQKKTREAIFAAFAQLLAQQPYAKITVQDIIDRADVGRTTFYAHFPTKDALLEQMCADLFAHVFSDRPGVEHSHDFSLSQGDARTIVSHILYHLRDNGRHMTHLLTGESSDVFFRYFQRYLSQVVVTNLFPQIRTGNPRVSAEFLQNHVAGSFVNMVQWWIRRGMQESPDALADAYLAVIEPIL